MTMMTWERPVLERMQQGMGPFKALGSAVLEEPTWGKRVVLSAAVVYGVGQALVHDAVIDPLTILRMNRAARHAGDYSEMV